VDSKQSRANKAKGTGFETDLERYLKSDGFLLNHQIVVRLAKSGRLDKGDLAVQLETLDGDDVTLIIEAKNAARFTPAEWVDQVLVERENYTKALQSKHSGYIYGVVIAKRRNKSASKAFVIMQLDEFCNLVGRGKKDLNDVQILH
jgi:hypothetical protein